MAVPLSTRLERMARWFQRDNERPLIGFTLGGYYPLRRYPNAARGLREGEIHPADICVPDYLDDTERLFQLHEEAGGDFVFSAAPFLGMPWIEASLGCRVTADHHTGSTRALPPVDFDGHIPDFREDNPWVAKMLEFIPALAAHSAGRYPIGVTLMRGISDLLAALYGSESFVLRMIDAPDEMHAVVGRLTEYWIAFGRSLLRNLPRFHDGTGSFFYGLWSPGELLWLQEDALALMSPTLYREFIYPADCRIAAAFPRTVMHLHPTRYIPSQLLARSELAAIELHVDHDGPRAQALEPHYRAILEHKPLYIWGDLTAADLDFVLGNLPHRGLAVNIVADSVEAAHQMCSILKW